MINNIIELNNILKNNTNYKLSNVTKGFSNFLLHYILKQKDKDNIIIFPNDAEAERFSNFIRFYDKSLDIQYFPSFSVEPYQRVSPNKSLMIKRINALSNLFLANKEGSTSKNVCTSVAAFIHKTISPSYLDGRFLDIKKDSHIKIEDLVIFLTKNNYKRVSLVSGEGEFALRGDIVDISSPGVSPLRIDFFDDIVERIRLFDILTQKSYEEIESITIKPSFEIILEQSTTTNFKYNYQNIFGKSNKELFELLDNKILPKGIENYLPLFYEDVATIYDYLQEPNIFIFDSFDHILQLLLDSYIDEYSYLKNDKNIFKTYDEVLDPAHIILQKNEVFEKIKRHSYFKLSNLREDIDNKENINFVVKEVFPSYSVYKNKKNDYVEALIEFISDNKDSKIMIFFSTEEFVEKLRIGFSKANIEFSLKIEDSAKVLILSNPVLEEGFIYLDNIIICEHEITGIKKTFSSKKSKANKILQQISSIGEGDILIHVKHGFGRYNGMQSISVNNVEHDFLEIWYKDEEKLFLPVENIDLISRHSGEDKDIVLDKLGSSSFEKKHRKVKEKIKDIAYDLIQIAAQRNLKSAPIIDFSKEDYDKFVKKFPYVETQDQLNAIHDVIDDLISGIPADRLICGDVGFGKTEVLLRAAFLVANSGYQVAIITPTTLLCNQHYNNFKERFSDFAIRIEQLSRFSSNKDKKQHKEDLYHGKIDIIIGTHALLAKDIKFKNLGLIVVDEEQSFGVVHKEKLKAIKEEVHVLTLSATPIPRTIQLAFKGIKDLSIMTTPPVDKLPIATYCLPVDYSAIKKAILREKNRGGQVYFVCPRISDIEEIKATIDNLNIDVSYIVAHGKISTEILEQNMIDFKDKKYDILISTNIIESGIDLHNVNTMIIMRSDMIGLAQLYQLRGRVGRGQTQAYAYLLYDDKYQLNEKAEKRLQILQNLDYLGASFTLASYDLDMRGAGNLLGEEQSGHIKEIGSDLYQKLLEQEILHIKSQKNNSTDFSLDYYNFSPNITLNIPIFIPKQYISDMTTLMEIYQKIGQINNCFELVELKEEMLDRFGPIPYQVENLFISVEIKINARKSLVEKVIFGAKGIQMVFYNNTFPKVEELLTYINSTKGLISLKPEGSIIINAIDLDIKEQVKTSLKVLGELQNLLYN